MTIRSHFIGLSWLIMGKLMTRCHMQVEHLSVNFLLITNFISKAMWKNL